MTRKKGWDQPLTEIERDLYKNAIDSGSLFEPWVVERLICLIDSLTKKLDEKKEGR